MQSAKTEI